MTLDLIEYYTEGSWVFSGRPRGETIRAQKRLDDADKKGEAVTVNVPHAILSLNSSFFLGLFGPSVRTYGEIKFREMYIFHGNPSIGTDIDNGIRQALKESNPLSK